MTTSARTSPGFFGQFADVSVRAPEQDPLLQQALTKVRAPRNPGRIACLFESATLFFGYARESVIAVTGCANDVLADPTN